MRASFDAFVTAVHFDTAGAAMFALGDGTVRFEDGTSQTAHDGAILCAALDPLGRGLLTGGDDGRLALTGRGGSETLAEVPGRWIETVAASPATGLFAYGAGRDLHVRDARDPAFSRRFSHERSVAGIDFEAKGRRIAVATYGGAVLWYARIADQKPVKLNWAGSHIACLFSPDSRFLISSMQENQLHGWRLSDAKDMRMGGYPSKVKSLAFLSKGAFLATAGAPGAVLCHLLEMSSGLTDPLESEAAPGARFHYNTPAYARLQRVLEAVAGQPLNTLTRDWLTGPLGMADTEWLPRPAELARMSGNAWGLVTAPRDLARLGEMVLARGVSADGARVISQAALARIFTPTATNPSYGWLWWLNGGGWSLGPGGERREGRFIAAAPSNALFALGAQGRLLGLVPSLELLVVRLGRQPQDAAFAEEFWRRLMAAV